MEKEMMQIRSKVDESTIGFEVMMQVRYFIDIAMDQSAVYIKDKNLFYFLGVHYI